MSEEPSSERLQLTWTAKLGVGLAIGSFIPWLLLLVVPFLPLSVGQKAIGAGFLVGLAEVMFWVGVILAGKAVVQRYRGKLKLGRIWAWIRGHRSAP
jgi:hypothetical protein